MSKEKNKNALIEWIDYRLPVFTFLNHELNEYPTPKNLNYFWNFGSLAGITLPDGYSICIWRTSFEEVSPSQAGIYMLQALPDESSASMLPVRRLFCRPRPLCKKEV